MQQRNKDEIGALWAKEGARGPYLSGKLDGIGDVVCFPINSSNPRSPTWRVLKSRPRDEAPAPQRYAGQEPDDSDDLGF